MKTFRQLAFTLAVLVPLSLSPQAMAQSALPGVGQVSIDEGANTLTLVVPYTGRNPYRVLWLNGPRRLVVDIEGMRLNGRQRSLFIGGGVVNQIRAGHFKYNVTRVVFDLTQAADLRVVTDGASQTLRITIYALGAQPGEAISVGLAPTPTRAPQSTPRPSATRAPIRQTPAPRPTATPAPLVPQARITPVPVETPMPEATPTPEAPLPEASLEPTPLPELTPEPLPTEEPAVVEQEFMVFGSRLFATAETPFAITELYPNGGSDILVDASTTGLPIATLGGAFGWEQMFSPNFGLTLSGRGMSYTVSDDQAVAAGFDITHKRSDYEGALRLRARLPLFAGLELAAEPGMMVRMMGVDSMNGTAAATPAENYLYSGWLGYGPSVAGGLGWHLFGPLSIVGTGEFNYLISGSMNQSTLTPVFPMMGWRAGGEARLDMGVIGLHAGYNLTNWSYTGADANDTLTQSWSGPYVRMNILY